MTSRLPGTTTAKVLLTLRLFTECRGRVRIADVVQRLGVSCATAYRYLAELEEAGLVSRFSPGQYVLGPESVALERVARDHEPYAPAAQPVMTALARDIGASIVLARPSGRRVVFLLDVPGPLGPAGLENIRGRWEALESGAAGETVLAPLSMMARHAGAAAQAIRSLPNDTRQSLEDTPISFKREGSRNVYRMEDPGIDTFTWAAQIRLGSQGAAVLGALVRRSSAPLTRANVGDRLWRAALRIEGRLKASRCQP